MNRAVKSIPDHAITRHRQAAGGRWYADWQHAEHAARFDGRSALSDRALSKHYEAFNDVRLLSQRLDRARATDLLEVGCATGEFYRYLRLRHPRVRYYGADVSRVAVARAREKYPEGRFLVTDPGTPAGQLVEALHLPGRPETVYAKDVVHHQIDPLGFVAGLLHAAQETVILRTRTRDRGATVTDPEQSCQYHYDGWMPYIVTNLQELLDQIRREAAQAEVVVYRHHMILGGHENRYLPKACYLPETGTAETAVGIFLRTDDPGRVRVEDRRDRDVAYSLGDRVALRLHRLMGGVVGQ